MDEKMEYQLIKAALWKSGCIAPGVKEDREPVYKLVALGLMEPTNEISAERIRTREMRVSVRVRLTEQGQAHVLTINPDDYTNEAWFPRPHDVRRAQERIKAGLYPVPKGKRK